MVDPAKIDEWKDFVETREESLYSGILVDYVIEIMEKLESGATIEEVQEVFDAQPHSGASYTMVRNIVKDFSKRGAEFDAGIEI